MKLFLLRTLLIASAVSTALIFSAWVANASPSNESLIRGEQEKVLQQKQLAIKAKEQKAAVEEVNALIVDSYQTLLDKVLDQLYVNISQASAGNKGVQIRALSKVRDDLDKQLDSLEDGTITPNRKKILQGVYFYLKSNVEKKIKGLQE